MIKLKQQINRTEVPYESRQEKLSVEIKTWQGEHETRYSIIFRSVNSSVSHSLSRTQLVLLKKELGNLLL